MYITYKHVCLTAGDMNSLTQTANRSVKFASVRLPRWYVAATKSGKERLAQQNLEYQGFRTFAPRFRKQWRHARRTELRLAPLFPGYIFVSFDPENAPWRSINGTMGVLRLLGSEVQPQPAPQSFVSALQARCKGEIVNSLIEQFEPGAPVRILTGPFADRVGTIEKLETQSRVNILLEIMGTETRLGLSPGQLAPA